MVTMEEPAQLLVYIEGAIADPMRVILPLTHVAGSSDPTQQPNAPSVSFEWLGPLSFDFGGTPTPLTVGSRIALELDQAGGGLWSDIWDDLWSPALAPGVPTIPIIRRFTGRVTDLQASADTQDLRTQVTAVGLSAEASSFVVGRAALPAQTETQRVAAYNAAAPTYAVINQAGTLGFVARDADPVGLLDALQQAAESTGARVWENGQGQIVYTGLDARKAATAGVTLEEFEILAPVGWAQHVAGLVNDVRIFYGPPPVSPATERASVSVQSSPSISAYGRQSLDIDTSLTNDDDATAFGAVVLAHWAQAFWDAPQIAIPAHLLDAAKWSALMRTTLGQIVTTEGVTSVPSTPAGEGRWLLEGYVQTWERDDSGRLTDDLQLAVSELERWIADGKTDTFTTATVAPASAPYLTPVSVSATVKSNGAPIAAGGVVEVRDGTVLLGSGATVGTTGVATISVRPQVGVRHLTVTFVGTSLLRPSSASVTVEVTPVTTVSVGLVIGPTSVREGTPVTMTATVTPIGATGSIRWQYTRDGGAWTDWSGQDSSVSPTTGKAVATWTPGGAGRAYVWRARYDPTPGSPFGTATSNTDAVTVLLKTTQTRTYSASWAATYQQDGDKRSDTSDCYQGYYSGTNGNQKSLAGIGAQAVGDWDGADITKVEVYLLTPHWNSAGGGTAVIGSYTGSSEPSSWPGSGVNTDRTRSSFDRGQGKWVNITSWGAGFASGSLRAIALGPGPSTSSEYYGYAEGTGADRPKIRITGDVWT